jgi:hypothetical protein
METIFEELLFNKELPIEGLEVIWRGHFSPRVRRKIEMLEKLRHRPLDVGVVLQGGTSSEDYIRDSDEMTRRIWREIEARTLVGYYRAGIAGGQ